MLVGAKQCSSAVLARTNVAFQGRARRQLWMSPNPTSQHFAIRSRHGPASAQPRFAQRQATQHHSNRSCSYTFVGYEEHHGRGSEGLGLRPDVTKPQCECEIAPQLTPECQRHSQTMSHSFKLTIYKCFEVHRERTQSALV